MSCVENAELVANIHDFAKAVRDGRLFGNAVTSETWNQTGFDRRYHQRAIELSKVAREAREQDKVL